MPAVCGCACVTRPPPAGLPPHLAPPLPFFPSALASHRTSGATGGSAPHLRPRAAPVLCRCLKVGRALRTDCAMMHGRRARRCQPARRRPVLTLPAPARAPAAQNAGSAAPGAARARTARWQPARPPCTAPHKRADERRVEQLHAGQLGAAISLSARLMARYRTCRRPSRDQGCRQRRGGGHAAQAQTSSSSASARRRAYSLALSIRRRARHSQASEGNRRRIWRRRFWRRRRGRICEEGDLRYCPEGAWAGGVLSLLFLVRFPFIFCEQGVVLHCAEDACA